LKKVEDKIRKFAPLYSEMYLLYVPPSTGKTASSTSTIRRIKMESGGESGGAGLTEEMSVGQLREKVAEVLVSQQHQEPGARFRMIHCGKVLQEDDKKLQALGISTRSSIQVIPMNPDDEDEREEVKIPPAPSSEDDIHQFMIAFGMAVRNPNFTQMAAKASKNLEDMCASVPGLDRDPVACAFISKPELMLSLLHPETFKYVAEKHPCLIEVANNLANEVAILESKPGASSSDQNKEGNSSGATNPFAYHLDEMSDDDFDDDESMETEAAAQTGGTGGAQPFQPISAEQLRAALNAATFGGGGGGLFGGVTGMGPAAPAPSMPPGMAGTSSGSGAGSSMQSPITQDQLAAALAAATGSSASSSAAMTPAAAVPSGSAAAANPFSFLGAAAAAAPAAAAGTSGGGGAAPNWEKELTKMREMGITDETLAKKALQLMGGDIQAAIELIFSGWDGMDDTTN